MAAPKYAKGRLAYGICQRCGLRDLLNNLRFDGYYPNIRVHYECYEPKHPQEKLLPLMDSIALWKPSPEQPNGLGPILSGSVSGSTIQLDWTHPDTLGARYERYTLFRQVHAQGDYIPVFAAPIVYDFDMRILTDPLSFLDSGVEAGVSYDYQVFTYDDYNNGVQSNVVTVRAPFLVPILLLPSNGSLSVLGNNPTISTGGALTFSITAGFNSNGPFTNANNANTYEPGFGETGATPSGNSAGSSTPQPVMFNGSQLVVFGVIKDSITGRWIVVCFPGSLPQNFFTNITFLDGSGNSYNLSSASASFNGNFHDSGFSVWAWQPVITNFPPLNHPITIHP